MKPQKEIYLLSLLYNYGKVGCLTDFEDLCGIPRKNRSFRIWIKSLIDIGVLENSDYKRNPHNQKVRIYKVNKKKMIKLKLRKMEIYPSYKRLFFDDYETL